MQRFLSKDRLWEKASEFRDLQFLKMLEAAVAGFQIADFRTFRDFQILVSLKIAELRFSNQMRRPITLQI